MIVLSKSESDVPKAGSFSAVGVFSEVFRVDALQHSEVFVNFDALAEKVSHLGAFGYLVGAQQSVVIQTLHVGAFVGEAGQLLVGLSVKRLTLYSWNSKGTSLQRLRWFSGISRR
jgi:hypothetical protein